MEIWKDIPGYEGKYQISNKGNVKSLLSDKNIKPFNCNGYLKITLYDNGRKKHKFVHRLVADAFCEKKDACNEVNHIDYNRQNNDSSNLEWITHQGNVRHSIVNMQGLKSRSKTNTNERYISFDKSKHRYKVTIKGKHYGWFKCLTEAIIKRDEIWQSQY